MFNPQLISSNTTNNLQMLEITRNKLHQIISNALKIAEKFIIDRKLIITGGMALDYMLKLQGDKLYDENTINGSIPDYDVYSTDAVTDAYDFADILEKAGYSNNGLYTIDCIRALHVNTMRIRLEYTSILEISYIPRNIYDKMPTLMYNKIRIIHPTWQKINMHRSLAYPLIDPPREVIFNRLNKDTERFNLLCQYYKLKPSLRIIDYSTVVIVPIAACITPTEQTQIDKKLSMNLNQFGPLKRIKLGTLDKIQQISTIYSIMPEEEYEDVLYGFTAYSAIATIYMRYMNKYAHASSDKLDISDLVDGIIVTELEISKSTDVSDINDIQYKSPINKLEYITSSKKTISTINDLCNDASNDEWQLYEPILDYIMPRYSGPTMDVYCLLDTYINIYKMKFGSSEHTRTFTIPCINLLLVYFLTNYNLTKDDMYLMYYNSLLKMQENMNSYVEFLFGDTDPSTIKLGEKYGSNISKALNIILDSPFYISKYYYGCSNRSESYILSDMLEYNNILRIQHKQEIKIPPVPGKYLPAKGPRPGPFNYAESTYFRNGGNKVL